jgi:AcrR family transcriptional regulator
MGRARAGILAGARRSLAEAGTRGLTMSGVADRGGVAKATVYNHFRSRDELVAGLVVDTVERLASDAAAAPDLESALAGAAGSAARLPELRGAVGHDAAVVAGLVRPGDGVGWVAARTAVAQVMAGHGVEASPERVELVLRWVSAVAVADPDPGAVAAEARVLAAGLLHGSPEGD